MMPRCSASADDLALDERRADVARAERDRPDAVGRSLERERLHEADDAVLRRHVAGLERRRDEPVHGGDDEDPPLAARLQVRPGVAREEERARQEHREERIPAVLVEVLERRDVLEAGVRDDRVEAAEALDGRGDGRAVALPRREVGGERLARAGGVGREVDREHLPAVGDEPLRDRAADAARGTGDERPCLPVTGLRARR